MVEPQPVTGSVSLALFQQFRARYPQGGVTSELVRVQDQAFVVRVHLHLDDTADVTALAADPVVEIAEDRARQRAFDLLGISAQPPAPEAEPPKVVAPKVPDSPSKPPAPPRSDSRSDAEITPELPPDEATLTPPLDLIQDPAATLPLVPSPTAAPTAAKAAMAAPISTPQAQTVTEPVPMPAPIDLSDVIAQTDVELKRLAWSVKDGRDYLEQTYDKRSRHDLTDEELLAFLLHLESLPTPIPSNPQGSGGYPQHGDQSLGQSTHSPPLPGAT